ncbi:hypothetical protein KI809_10680 [Geobacter pelophilus]|uniref:Uncharacterized protein n=1 Tax=Geoanaerobacter pelophilus TaxID=60036 RepID=A0AAW4L864_9BACT|nr:hypothetical protein [Geoanaerobacter pelophilus]MBT0664765.1 hypothetical protein [Geoanaerobacter pelophilus]
MEFDYKALQFWFLAACTLGNWIYAWWSNRDKITAARFTDLENRLTALEIKGTCVNHDAMHKQVDKAVNSLEWIKGKVDGMNRAVDLLVENELRGDKK